MKMLLVSLCGLSLLWGCQSLQPEVSEKLGRTLQGKLLPAIAALKQQGVSVTPRSSKLSDKTIPIEIFHADRRCLRLVAVTEEIPIPASKENLSEIIVAAALQKAIEQQAIPGFTVANYNVTIDNGTATIDITVNPRSSRQVASLSSCEQFAFFKAIAITLTQNKSLNIRKVIFTQGKQEIYL